MYNLFRAKSPEAVEREILNDQTVNVRIHPPHKSFDDIGELLTGLDELDADADYSVFDSRYLDHNEVAEFYANSVETEFVDVELPLSYWCERKQDFINTIDGIDPSYSISVTAYEREASEKADGMTGLFKFV